MSTVIEVHANSVDEAIALSLLYLNTNAPIVVYSEIENTEIKTLDFPYSSDKIEKVLDCMYKNYGIKKVREMFDLITVITP